jgi:hypothetical protein
VLWLFESPRENDGSNSGEGRESRFTSGSDGKFEGSPAHQQRIKLRPKRGEINLRVRANPVVFFIRPRDMAIEAHRHCITNFSHTYTPARAMTALIVSQKLLKISTKRSGRESENL